MSRAKRTKGKLVRKIAKLDRAWKEQGKPGGKAADNLAFLLGDAYRAGVGPAARKAQRRNG